MSRKGAGFTVGQLMVAVVVGAVTVAACLAVDAAVRRHRATEFPPGPPPGQILKVQGYGDK